MQSETGEEKTISDRGRSSACLSLWEDSPGQGGAGRGSAPSRPSSGGQRDEGPGPKGAIASVLRDH